VPVLIGGTAEEHILTDIQQSCEKIINLSGRTSIQQLSMLAKGALLSVGNDTGPMHVIAASGCPSLVLFSAASDPARSAPQGEHVKILRRDKLVDLSPEEVLEKALSLV
jgi:ADP-heptose:LPS heptosyltransferase